MVRYLQICAPGEALYLSSFKNRAKPPLSSLPVSPSRVLCAPGTSSYHLVPKHLRATWPRPSGIWNALPNHLLPVPFLPVFRRALKHHLFLLAYPDSSAKSGMIKPAQCISLRDTVPTTAIAHPVNTMPRIS